MPGRPAPHGLAGGGNVVGPASSTDAHIAVFNGTSGTVIKDGGKTVADLLAGVPLVSDTAPVGAPDSSPWFERDATGGGCIFFTNDGMSTQWVTIGGAMGPIGAVGAPGATGQNRRDRRDRRGDRRDYNGNKRHRRHAGGEQPVGIGGNGGIDAP